MKELKKFYTSKKKEEKMNNGLSIKKYTTKEITTCVREQFSIIGIRVNFFSRIVIYK